MAPEWNVSPKHMNLVHSSWIPTDVGTVTPLDALTRGKHISWGRGDWDMATLCFLHALVQTAILLDPKRCPTRDAWERFLRTPPSDLDTWLNQDLGDAPWQCATAAGLTEISRLLPETPGDNTIKKSSDIARWAQDVPSALTPDQAHIALISDNLWGTRVGTGYYQGSRGEQALMTLIEPTSDAALMWHRVWLNVMPLNDWQSHVGSNEIAFEYPWKRPLGKDPLTPDNTNLLELLWQMPRRWRLIYDDDGFIRTAHRENKGRDYSGWERLHPLTPYFCKSDGTWTAAKIAPHAGFDDWAALTLSRSNKSSPAAAVSAFLESGVSEESVRLRCCGWSLGGSGEAGAWVDNVLPLYRKTDEEIEQIEQAIEMTRKQQKGFMRAVEAAGVTTSGLSGRMFDVMEPAFYKHVKTGAWGEDHADWARELRKSARDQFWVVMDSHRIDIVQATKAFKTL